MHSDPYTTRNDGQIGSAQSSVKLLASEHSMSVAVMETWEALNSGVAICAGPPAIAQCARQRAQSCTRQGCGPSGLRRCDTPRILILKNRLDICGSTRRRSQCGAVAALMAYIWGDSLSWYLERGGKCKTYFALIAMDQERMV